MISLLLILSIISFQVFIYHLYLRSQLTKIKKDLEEIKVAFGFKLAVYNLNKQKRPLTEGDKERLSRRLRRIKTKKKVEDCLTPSIKNTETMTVKY